MPPRSEHLLVAVASRLRHRTDDLVERQLAVLRRFPSYDRVPADDLRRSCRRNVARVVATLEQHDREPAQIELPAHIEEDERSSGQRRALQGVPSDDVVEAYRAVLSVLRDAFIDEAGAADADPRSVLAGTRRLWDLTDRYSNVLVSARQQVEIDAARRDERHRMAFLQRLLTGGVEHAELVEGGAVHGVLPDHEYWVLRGRQRSGDPQRLSRHLELSPTIGTRPLVTLVDDDVAGISTARPAPLDGAVIAVAGPVALAGVATAFTEATRVLTVAVRYDRSGVVDSSSLSVRVAVEQQAELGEQLYRRYVSPFRDAGAASEEVLQTIHTYLHQHRSVATTATLLSVHENTVRYRLERFRTVTGRDLSDTDVLVEVWWALEYATIRVPRSWSPTGPSA
ncbi:PucR family transcriptional regulator [Pseudonocardia sp. GCM10023141]|uniref:PucR family transcriptional regulator n=1 Tax=Pseudonocardia sp. GCM10023141 TaxID=3252653 RepID=UPI00360CCF53